MRAQHHACLPACEMLHCHSSINMRAPHLVPKQCLGATGINSVMFYAPVLFKTLGSSDSASLLNTVIVGAHPLCL